MQASKGALGAFLEPSVNPHKEAEDVQSKVYAAEPGGIDLLRYDYQAGGKCFMIYEGINFVVARIGPDEGLSQVFSRQDVASLIDEVVRLEAYHHTWEFEIPEKASGEPILISTRGAPPVGEIASRDDRADLVIDKDYAYFVFCKKVAQLEDFRPDDSWFSSTARTAIRKSE